MDKPCLTGDFLACAKINLHMDIMRFFKKLFSKKQEAISYAEFWEWFVKNEQRFYQVVKKGKNFEAGFFDPLSEKLEELRPDIYYLTGMMEDDKAELIFSTEGKIRLIVFIEELVAASPGLENWKFTALKPSSEKDTFEIKKEGKVFNSENISFYANEIEAYPDEIDLTLVYHDWDENDAESLKCGVALFLENWLGELEMATNIDNYNVVGPDAAEKELIPISKLRSYLNWREKEFLEKYDNIRLERTDFEFTILKFEPEDSKRKIVTVNGELLEWDQKGSHPWMTVLTITYESGEEPGMPKTSDQELMYQIEDEVDEFLNQEGGYLWLARSTGWNERKIYWACHDFRQPSKVLDQAAKRYKANFDFKISIFRDKYWMSVDKYNPKYAIE
jgi:Family of unknown function (DUF695)